MVLAGLQLALSRALVPRPKFFSPARQLGSLQAAAPEILSLPQHVFFPIVPWPRAAGAPCSPRSGSVSGSSRAFRSPCVRSRAPPRPIAALQRLLAMAGLALAPCSAADLSVLVLILDATAPQPRHEPGCVCPLLWLAGGQCPRPAFSLPCLGLAHPCRSAMLCGGAPHRHRFNRSALFPGQRSTLSFYLPAPLFHLQLVEVDLGSVPIAVELPDTFLSARSSSVLTRSRARGFKAMHIRRAALSVDVHSRQTSPSTLFK
jgi:hypothetical protein